jgi:hypothetical protein
MLKMMLASFDSEYELSALKPLSWKQYQKKHVG